MERPPLLFLDPASLLAPNPGASPLASFFQDTPAAGQAPAGETGGGEGTATGTAEKGEGTGDQGGRSPAPQGDFLGTLILFGGMFLLLWVFLLGPERRKKKQLQEQLSQLKEKDEVVTIGGILGTVVRIEGEVVTLRVDEKRGSTLRIARGSIASIPARNASAGEPKAEV